MSKSKPITPLELVKLYHGKYIEYEIAFNKNPINQEDLRKELEGLVGETTDTESDEFFNKMANIVIEKPQRRADVNTAGLKFLLYADFYKATNTEELPENIEKDYEGLSVLKDNFKFFNSIENGDFVKNEDVKMDDNTRAYFKSVYKQIKAQQ